MDANFFQKTFKKQEYLFSRKAKNRSKMRKSILPKDAQKFSQNFKAS